jgi:hypothetical protein
MGGNVPIDSEKLLVTDFVNLKIKSTQSFRYTHRDMMCICVFIGVIVHTCMIIYHLYCVSQKNLKRSDTPDQSDPCPRQCTPGKPTVAVIDGVAACRQCRARASTKLVRRRGTIGSAQQSLTTC